jgi:hypothetical protein
MIAQEMTEKQNNIKRMHLVNNVEFRTRLMTDVSTELNGIPFLSCRVYGEMWDEWFHLEF